MSRTSALAAAAASVLVLAACAPPGYRLTASRRFYLWIEKEEGAWKAPVTSEPRGLTLPLKEKPLGVLIVAVESAKDKTPAAVPELLREHEAVLRAYVTERGATRYHIRRMEHRIRDVNIPYPAGGHTMYRHMDVGYMHLEIWLYE